MKSGHNLNLTPGVKRAARFPDGPAAALTWEIDLRKGSSGGRKGHGLSVPFNILTTCVLSSPCLWPCVCVCVCLSGCLCVLACGSSQTDNHRGGRAKSKRDECSVYWNECKDRLQCQTGRICVCVRSALISAAFTLAWEQKSGAWKAVCLFAVQTLPPAENNTNLPVLDGRVPKGGSEVESQYSTPVDF